MKKQIMPTLAGLVILLTAGWYVDHVARDEIAQAIRFTVNVIAFALALAAIAFALFFVLSAYERVMTRRAGRHLAEREADVMVVTAGEGEQVFIRETDTKALWRNAHLDGRIYANGQKTAPTRAEFAAWQTWALRQRPQVIKDAAPGLLPPITQADLLTALDSVRRCLIVGASNSGKTTVLQWLVSRRLNTSKVIVIDPHAWPNKWPTNCVVIGTGRNYQEIDKALDALVRLMTKRYDEIGKGIVVEQGHPHITILIDEWRAIVYNLGKPAGEAIKALLTESHKAAFSVFVATHSDRAKPLGLEGEYDLKDGFCVVRLTIADGQRQATIDYGNGEAPATLPGPYHGNGSRVIEAGSFLDLEPEPSPTEAHILNLYEQGESVSAIAAAVFGSKGGNQNQRIKDILSKFEMV